MENEKIAIGIVLAAIAIAFVLVAPASASEYYLVPDDSYAQNYGGIATVELRLNATQPISGGLVSISHEPGVGGNITDISFDSEWETHTKSWHPNEYTVQFRNRPGGIETNVSAGDYLIGTFTIKCENASYHVTDLIFNTTTYQETDLWAIGVPHVPFTVDDGTFTCKNIPDLVVTDVSPQVVDPAAGTYKVQYTVKNTGNANAGAFWVNLTVDGTQNATEYVSGGLAAGASYTGNFSSHIETVSGNSDIVMVCADYNNTVEEKTYEDNNCMSKEFFAALTVDIGNYVILPGGSKKAPITVRSMKDYGSTALRVAFNKSVVEVTGVSSSTDSTVVSYTNLTKANTNGFINISAMNTEGTGAAKDIILAYVTFHDIGGAGKSTDLNLTVFQLKDTSYNTISTNDVDGSITIRENEPPEVTNATVSPIHQILNYANGRDRPEGRYRVTLSVNVTDNVKVASVTIDLSSIGGGSAVPMTQGTGDTYYVVIDSVNGTNIGTAGVNETHCFLVNATDTSGNSNTLVCIGPLEILRRGDVVRDNVVDMGDALYIARYSIGLETVAPDVFVGDVVGPGNDAKGDGKVDMGDALFIARYTVGLESYV